MKISQVLPTYGKNMLSIYNKILSLSNKLNITYI